MPGLSKKRSVQPEKISLAQIFCLIDAIPGLGAIQALTYSYAYVKLLCDA